MQGSLKMVKHSCTLTENAHSNNSLNDNKLVFPLQDTSDQIWLKYHFLNDSLSLFPATKNPMIKH